jgi:WD40 repeat protein
MTLHSCIFTNNLKTFLHISDDNRIHLWKTATGKEREGYIDKNHLAHSFTCLTWIEGANQSLGNFAAGFDDGVVVVWDLVRGVELNTFGRTNSSFFPTDIAFSNNRSTIFISSSQSQIEQYDLLTGKKLKSLKASKSGVSKMAMNPKVDVVAAGR